MAKFRARHFFQEKQIQSTFSKYTELPWIRKLKNFHEQFFSKFTVKSKNGQNWPKMAKKWPKMDQSIFFGKKKFCYFFVTYQGLTRCKKSKKSNERILRSGERTNERTDERTELRRQIYRTNLQSRWVQKLLFCSI